MPLKSARHQPTVNLARVNSLQPDLRPDQGESSLKNDSSWGGGPETSRNHQPQFPRCGERC